MVNVSLSETDRIPLLPAEEYARRQRRSLSSLPEVWDLLDSVKDPEIPAISLWELGVLQDIEWRGDTLVVTITPTYSGCPAVRVMQEDVSSTLADAGYADHQVESRLSPAWSTQWITPEGSRKLENWGIAPPVDVARGDVPRCPHCGSDHVRELSEFGATACKALYQCRDCAEPFDYFKSI